MIVPSTYYGDAATPVSGCWPGPQLRLQERMVIRHAVNRRLRDVQDAPAGGVEHEMDPPFQNSPTRLRQNSPTCLFSDDHG
jgi:hypothetical protein